MIPIKRGDTFDYTATVLGDGVPIVGGIAAWGIRSQIRTKAGALVDTLICTITDSVAGTFTIVESAADVTLTWPTVTLEMDIEYTIDGTIVSTETIEVEVTKDVTI